MDNNYYVTSINFMFRPRSVRDLNGGLLRTKTLFERNLYPAARALGCECEIDLATELMRDELAYQVCAVARLDRSHDRWTAKLTPFDHQTCRRIAIGMAVPVHRHPTVWARQRTIFCSVGHQLVKHHRQRLRRRSGKH